MTCELCKKQLDGPHFTFCLDCLEALKPYRAKPEDFCEYTVTRKDHIKQLEAEIAELKKLVEAYEYSVAFTASSERESRIEKLVSALDRVLTTQEVYLKYAVEGEPGGPFTRQGEHLAYTESKLDVERRNALEAARQALATYRREAGEDVK